MHLVMRVNEHIDFQMMDERGEIRSINTPHDIAEALLKNYGRWEHIPRITGIVTAPTLRLDGTLIDQPGYDPDTRILYVNLGVEYPKLPRPDKDQARAALDYLCELYSEFPFTFQNGDDATDKSS